MWYPSFSGTAALILTILLKTAFQLHESAILNCSIALLRGRGFDQDNKEQQDQQELLELSVVTVAEI